MIRNPHSVHVMNRYVSLMARDRPATVWDIDCMYHHRAKNFWCMFEWKWESEKNSSPNTIKSLMHMDEALSYASSTYRGLFLFRCGWPAAFPMDDTQQCEIQHFRCGEMVNHRTYTEGAQSALQYILDYGQLL